MARQKLEGIYIPVITPFNKDESINFAGIKEVAKFLADNGVTGIIPSGSTGELIAMEKDEIIAVNKAYIEAFTNRLFSFRFPFAIFSETKTLIASGSAPLDVVKIRA